MLGCCKRHHRLRRPASLLVLLLHRQACSSSRHLSSPSAATASACRKGLSTHVRLLSSSSAKLAATIPPALQLYKDRFCLSKASAEIKELSDQFIGKHVILHGYLGPRSDVSKNLSFVPLLDRDLKHSVQVISATKDADDESVSAHARLKKLGENVPVVVEGVVQSKVKPKGPSKSSDISRNEDVEIKLQSLALLNDFQANTDLSETTVIPAEKRHLQLRQSRFLRDALHFRSALAKSCRDYLTEHDNFAEIETPLLFKSTPEGAREFLVPTRTAGYAYALPQSPQQYKQILMASGIPRYFQIARCFRDEDLRADRQPEFTQLDLEMSFATGEDVMNCIESLVKHLWKSLLQVDFGDEPFRRMSYQEAMSRFGSDKPDMRLGSEIMRIDHMIPVDLVSKIGPLTKPIVEAFVLRGFGDTSSARDFVSNFMDSSDALPFLENPDGQPGIFIYDPRKPLGGLQPFGFEAAEVMEETFSLDESDIVFIQARKDESFSGGSTMLGNLRLAVHRSARAQGLLEPASGWEFLWVNQFPLFSPSVDNEPGQGGEAGLSSTHHPFTAPAFVEDVDLLVSDPLSVKADHYDLVLNGVEIGGGSRRIHVAEMQEFILRDVLKVPEQKLQDFNHHLDALRAGCPPHAGIALGFDRLCAVMLGKESIRDVIAFPKTGSGSDPLVKSPTLVTDAQLATYHLKLKS